MNELKSKREKARHIIKGIEDLNRSFKYLSVALIENMDDEFIDSITFTADSHWLTGEITETYINSFAKWRDKAYKDLRRHI